MIRVIFCAAVCFYCYEKGKLEWGDCSKSMSTHGDATIDKNDDQETCNIHYGVHDPCKACGIAALTAADVLLAADVVYDVDCIPDLIATVSRFLTSRRSNRGNEEKVALFATTFRNKDTFRLFEKELETNAIRCEYLTVKDQEDLPNVFPCYFQQPRTDVRVCTMRLES